MNVLCAGGLHFLVHDFLDVLAHPET
jgi:hypothetical protein